MTVPVKSLPNKTEVCCRGTDRRWKQGRNIHTKRALAYTQKKKTSAAVSNESCDGYRMVKFRIRQNS